MNDEQYLAHCKAQLAQFADTLATRCGELPDEHPLRALSTAFSDLAASAGDLYEKGPSLVARLFETFPEFAPTFPRQLLWFFGGQCLHFMADEEIARFQQLEEMRLAAAERGEILDLTLAGAGSTSLH